MKNSHLSFIDKFQYFFCNGKQAASFQDGVNYYRGLLV